MAQNIRAGRVFYRLRRIRKRRIVASEGKAPLLPVCQTVAGMVRWGIMASQT
ncbi:hypothetical protein [Microvirga yunnanensis]|uniref:hypothetical protein n=1 Tax=Microvirga yunnanensis TaxID=2953740 RepID=UPI0021C5C7CC|nr:hypothetical protein [Microvirga sp. HBU65207]